MLIRFVGHEKAGIKTMSHPAFPQEYHHLDLGVVARHQGQEVENRGSTSAVVVWALLWPLTRNGHVRAYSSLSGQPRARRIWMRNRWSRSGLEDRPEKRHLIRVGSMPLGLATTIAPMRKR